MFQDNKIAQVKSLLTKQLYKDYDNILYTYDVKLKTPIIQIVDAVSYYGQWCSKTRMISLSFALFKKNSWADILEVLKHEMAHQYVDEVLGESDGHGPFFQKACDALRVSPWARKSFIDLSEPLKEKPKATINENESQPVRLIRKLLQLSQSSNRHEAFLALQKASELAQKYQIESFQLDLENNFVGLVLHTNSQKVQAFESHIVQILTSYFGVKVIYSSLFNIERLREEKTLEFFGTENSVKMAEYVYLFLKRKVFHLWEEHKKQNFLVGLRNRNQFFYGVLSGLEKHLQQSSENSTVTKSKVQSFLPTKLDQKLQNFIAKKHPKIKETKTRQAVSLSKVYQAGYAQGNKIRIFKPLPSEKKRYLL